LLKCLSETLKSIEVETEAVVAAQTSEQNATSSTNTNLILTMEDTINGNSDFAEATAKLKRKKMGRQSKILSDLFLLQGMVQESLLTAEQAISETKSNTDRLWLGSSYETKAAGLHAYEKGIFIESSPKFSTSNSLD